MRRRRRRKGNWKEGIGWQPSSSNYAPRASHQESFGTVPSISITAPSDRNSADESRDEVASGRNEAGGNQT